MPKTMSVNPQLPEKYEPPQGDFHPSKFVANGDASAFTPLAVRAFLRSGLLMHRVRLSPYFFIFVVRAISYSSENQLKLPIVL